MSARALLGWALVCAACAAGAEGARTTPRPVDQSRGPEPAPVSVVSDAGEEADERAIEAQPDAQPDALPASAAVAPPDPSDASVAKRRRAHCFDWIHLDDFSTDCAPTPGACAKARADMKHGARDVTPCREVRGTTCTFVSRPPDPNRTERCFGDAGACGRYRAYVQGNGLTATPCRDQ